MPSPSSSSSSASGSASPSRSPSPILDPRTTEAHPKKKTARPAVADGARNEGTNPSWAFKPPPGATALDHTAECGPFDWDAVEGEDFELWLVRVPADVKPKHLETVKLDSPASTRPACIGAISRKHANYNIWSVGPDAAVDEKHASGALGAGVEEMRGLSCLLPRKRKGGKLFASHKPFARHIVIAAQPATHTPSTEPGALLAEQYRNPLRYSYPEEVLKHRFAPYGSATIGSPITDDSGGTETIFNVAEDVDVAEVAVPAQEGKEKKNKKRKGEKEHVEGKKPKKAKVAGA